MEALFLSFHTPPPNHGVTTIQGSVIEDYRPNLSLQCYLKINCILSQESGAIQVDLCTCLPFHHLTGMIRQKKLHIGHNNEVESQ